MHFWFFNVRWPEQRVLHHLINFFFMLSQTFSNAAKYLVKNWTFEKVYQKDAVNIFLLQKDVLPENKRIKINKAISFVGLNLEAIATCSQTETSSYLSFVEQLGCITCLKKINYLFVWKWPFSCLSQNTTLTFYYLG